MSIRILLIDGNSTHLEVLTTALFQKGIHARCFRFAEEALIDYPNYRPHLVICEPVLVESAFPGWGFAFEILKGDPKERPLLIAFANRPSRLNKALCEECGFDKFIVKPVDPDVLMSWVYEAKLHAAKIGMVV